jgi:hypothetical protein
MTLGLLVAGAALVALPGVGSQATRRLPPAECASLVAGSLAVGAVGLEVGLVLLALPTVLQSVGMPGLATACATLVGHLAPGGPVVGWLAAGAAVAIAAVSLHTLGTARQRARKLRAEPGLGQHLPLAGFELVELPTAVFLAVSVPGRPPQVVVSRGLVERLEPAELEAVVRHEAAHLALRHRRHLLLAAVLERGFGLVPFARRSAGLLRTTVERWADEAAVGPEGRRRDALNRALLTVAPARITAKPPATRALDRVAGHNRVPWWEVTATRVGLYGPAFVFLAGAVAFLAGWVVDAEHLIALGGYCPD